MNVHKNLSEVEVKALRKSFTGSHHTINTSDKTSLFLRSWIPENETKIAVVILHGVTAYSGPYEIIAKPLQQAGFQVFGLDLRGHGLSDGNRGDYKSEELLYSDLNASLNFIRKDLGFEKVILLGHSLGVLTSLIVTFHNLGEIDGLALFSAGLETREGVRSDPSLLTKLKILFSSIIWPSKPVIVYYRDGMTGINDQLYNFYYTLRFFKIFSIEKINLPISVNVPVYVAVGDQDELFSIETAKDLFEKIESENKTFQILKNSKHAEFDKGTFSHFIDWLNNNFESE